MSWWQKIRDLFVGSPPDEVITGQMVDQPKDYPDGLPKNHTEHVDKLGIAPGSKIL